MNEIISTNSSAMIYFGGNYCNVCNSLKPKIKELFDTNFRNTTQYYFNVEEQKQFATSLNVYTIPTVLVFFDGKEFLRKSRHMGIDEIKSKLNRIYDLYYNSSDI